MRNLLPIAYIIFLLLNSGRLSAQITFGTIDNGPYGRGSSISVPINIPPSGNCYGTNNSFQLFISDANGNFANEVKIGESSGFFSTHLNGIIPDNFNAGTNYKLRVKTTNPASVTSYAGTINILTAEGPQLLLQPTVSSQILSPETFGWCGSAVGANKGMVLRELAGSDITEVVLKNCLTGATQNIARGPSGFVLDNLPLAYFMVTASGEKQTGASLVRSTRTFLLLNAPSKVNIQSGGTDYGCIDPETKTGADIAYTVNITGENGIQNNYPGSSYQITWGDGVEDSYTHCELINNNGFFMHSYKKSSCGEPPINLGNGTVVRNAFRVSITTVNPFCSSDPASATTYPKIFAKPIAHIDETTARAVCVNTPVVFTNASTAGNNSDCSLTMQYKWYVDDVLVSTDDVLNYSGFSTTGQHVVRLVASNDVGLCRPTEDIRSVCVQNPPEPGFNFNGQTGTMSCGPLSIKATNTSVIDENCNAENSYLWTVTGGPVTYDNGTDETSREPVFHFSSTGLYKVSLSIKTASCGTITTPEQTVVINGPPTATLSPDFVACNPSAYEFSNTTGGPTKTELTGTSETQASTYSWSVTGGDYEFSGGTDAHSQYPIILFKEFKIYTVTVTHSNNCGNASDSQVITFRESPVVDAGTYSPICYSDPVNLKGNISGTYKSYEWVGGNGTFAPGRNDLNAIYTPSADERDAGTVDLILRVYTDLQAPCDAVEAMTTISIKARNVITSASSKSICPGSSVDYAPEALAGSTFSWTVSQSDKVTGFASSGSGSRITDVLTNTDPSANGSITYLITPSFNGCQGEAFELSVTVEALPIATVTVADPTICSGSPVGINLASNQAGTRYLWTSSSSNTETSGNTQNTSSPADISEISDVILNNGTTGGSVTYTITPISLLGCSGSPVTVTVSIKPAPVIENNTIADSETICEDDRPSVIKGSTPTGAKGSFDYQWQSSNDGLSWTNIPDETGIDYAPAMLTETTYIRRLVILPNCSGTLEFPSNAVTITVNYNAKAAYTFTEDTNCIPFKIDQNNIKATPYADRNGTYTWYADGISIGTGINFPGYTIKEDNKTVEIKLVVTSLKGCKPAEFSHTFSSFQTIVASFDQDKSEGCGPTTVHFTNRSTTISGVTFSWNFGNGQTSSEVNPAPVTFNPDPTGKDKIYKVTLVATSNCGESVPFEAEVLVRSDAISIFSPDKTVGCSPLDITFSNTSPEASNTTYTYDFGDGSAPLVTNDRSSVTHTYTTDALIKSYTIKMTAKGPCSEHTSEHTITVQPNTIIAELVVNGPDKRGCAPFTVPFFNNTTGADAFTYDFGDGTSTSTISAPERVEHTFTQAGTYTITLTASNDCSTASTTETITVLPQPVLSFSADQTSGCPGLEVKFNNTSTDGASYLWDFGDGSTSTDHSPTHIFGDDQEYYTVTLTAKNSLGCPNTLVMTNYIHIYPLSVVAIEVEPGNEISIPNYTFRFSDQSSKSPVSWLWDFGDGTTSTEKNPRHTYDDVGSYKVSLTVTNQNGCASSGETLVSITGVPGYLQIPNAFTPGAENGEFRRFAAKGTGIKSWKFSVFNKWGELMWETDELVDGKPGQGWDGTYKGVKMPQGVYFWKAEVEFINGSEWKGMSYNNSSPKRTGIINLIR